MLLYATPAAAHTQDFIDAFVWVLVGVGYGIVLIALIIGGIVFLATKQRRPTYGRVAQIGPSIATVLYIGIAAWQMGYRRLFVEESIVGVLLAFSPIIVLTIATVAIGSSVRRRHYQGE